MDICHVRKLVVAYDSVDIRSIARGVSEVHIWLCHPVRLGI